MNQFDAKAFLKTLTSRPGVYQMLGSDDKILYVGKAKNLKKRVSSYFLKNVSLKTQSLVQQIASIRVIITHSEAEALILENNLIKEHRPRYNILFRDDKSYPYIYATTHTHFPRMDFYRGSRKLPGKYFGPYFSVNVVRDTLNLMQKIFLLRSCQDTFFNNRSRPCLQYQIKRCSAPCVGYINEEEYKRDFNHALNFLEGKDETVLQDLQNRMQEAAKKLDYESAAKYRDQITKIREIQAKQYAMRGRRNIDVIACVKQNNAVCLCLLIIRDGCVLGNKNIFPKAMQEDEDNIEIIQSFIAQYYLSGSASLPDVIVTENKLSDEKVLAQALEQELKQAIQFQSTTRDETKKWHAMAEQSAKQALSAHLANKTNIQGKFAELNFQLKTGNNIERIECFDISHMSGEATVASCVVFDLNGAKKAEYRHFNIEDVAAGDDYAAMRQALFRRYQRLKKEEAKLPDLLLIDGGKGQLTQAEAVLEELQIKGVYILGIAKGRTRKPGLETLFLSGREEGLHLPDDSVALHLLQQIRDEAHRFAITHNRQRVAKKRTVSRLQDIEGVGAKRRQALLKYFGGLPAVMQASVDQLAKVSGISKQLAEKIYDALHDGD